MRLYDFIIPARTDASIQERTPQHTERQTVTAPIQTYTIAEVRKFYKVARSTVYQWFRLGLKSLKVGNVRRIRDTDLNRFMDRHRAG